MTFGLIGLSWGGDLLELPSLGKSGDLLQVNGGLTRPKGQLLTVYHWVRRGTGPAQGEKLTFQSICDV